MASKVKSPWNFEDDMYPHVLDVTILPKVETELEGRVTVHHKDFALARLMMVGIEVDEAFELVTDDDVPRGYYRIYHNENFGGHFVEKGLPEKAALKILVNNRYGRIS